MLEGNIFVDLAFVMLFALIYALHLSYPKRHGQYIHPLIRGWVTEATGPGEKYILQKVSMGL